MTWPLDLNAWAERIESANVAGVKSVGLGADLQRAAQSAYALPAVFVLPSDETVAMLSRDSVPRARRAITCRVGIVIGLLHYGDRAGGKANDALQPIRKGIADALHAWKIDAFTTAAMFAGGSAANITDTAQWWIDTYEVTIHDQ